MKLAQRDPPVNNNQKGGGEDEQIIIEQACEPVSEQQRASYVLFWQLLLGRILEKGTD